MNNMLILFSKLYDALYQDLEFQSSCFQPSAAVCLLKCKRGNTELCCVLDLCLSHRIAFVRHSTQSLGVASKMQWAWFKWLL